MLKNNICAKQVKSIAYSMPHGHLKFVYRLLLIWLGSESLKLIQVTHY